MVGAELMNMEKGLNPAITSVASVEDSSISFSSSLCKAKRNLDIENCVILP